MLAPIFRAAVAVVLMIAPAAAQDRADRRLDGLVPGDLAPQVVPGTSYRLVAGTSQLERERGTVKRAFVAAVQRWVASETGLPLPSQVPRVAFVESRTMQDLRYRHADASPTAASVREGPALFAVYDDADRTIYLPRGWTGRTPAEVSILVHEMVHHLQNLSGQTFACPGEREKPAYAVQERWLALFGGDLLRDFSIDPMTRLVRTVCVF